MIEIFRITYERVSDWQTFTVYRYTEDEAEASRVVQALAASTTVQNVKVQIVASNPIDVTLAYIGKEVAD